jgi:hypothetical protein
MGGMKRKEGLMGGMKWNKKADEWNVQFRRERKEDLIAGISS